MTDNIESVNVVSGPLPNPPDGYGTQLSFSALPPYMQNMLRKMWHDLAVAEQECIRKNLEDWGKAEKRADFSGPLTVGPIPAGADKNARGKSSKSKHQTYGNFDAESTVTEDV
jgi:hypothetical protein